MEKLILIGLHWILVYGVNYYGLIMITDQMMYRRRSLKPLIIVCYMRLILTCIGATYIYYYYGTEAINHSKGMTIYGSVCTLIHTIVMFWTYENAGASLLGAVAEMVDYIILNISYIPVAIIRGNNLANIMTMEPLVPTDFVFMIIFFPLLWAVIKYGQHIFANVRKLQFNNKIFWISLSYLLFIYTKYWDISEMFNFLGRKESLMALISFMPVVVIIWILYESDMTLEYDFLLKQKKIQHIYYGALRSQIYSIQKDMEESQRHIMGLLEAEEEQGGDIYLEEYIKRMKARSQVISAGIYCQNQMVDSVLFSYSEQFEKQDVGFTVKVANVSMRGLSEDQMFELLITLLDLGLNNKKGEDLTFSMNQVKGRQVIELGGLTSKPDALAIRRVKEISTKNHGLYDLVKERGDYRFIVYMDYHRKKAK